jgi:aspartate aminotransferase
VGAEALVDLPDQYYADIVTEYAARRDVVVEALRQIPGAAVPEVHGAFYVMARLPIDDADAFCRWLLESYADTSVAPRGETVMLAPGPGFYATPGLGRDEVRIAYVLERDSLRRAMGILAGALKVYPGRREAVAAAV